MSEECETMQLKVYLFGSPRIEKNGAIISVDTRKAIALIAFLAVTKQNHSRDVLCNLLWPEYQRANASRNLRRTLWSLNKAIGKEWLTVDRNTVELNYGSNLWVDVNRFQYLVDSSRTHTHESDTLCSVCHPLLQDAISLVQGDFMAGFYLRDGENFEEWQSFQSRRLQQELLNILEKLASYHSLQGEFEAAIRYLQRCLSVDVLQERAHVKLMQAFAQSGQKAEAIRQYQQCKKILDRELGVSPQPETNALYSLIYNGSSFNSAFPPAVQTTDLQTFKEIPFEVMPERGALPQNSSMHLSPNPLFVGREKALRTLARVISQGMASAIGQTIVLTGMGGIGKSQLAVEFSYRYGRYFPGGIFWINMSSADGIPPQIAACGGVDGLNLRPDFDELPLDKQVKLVQRAWRDPVPRLLIFDDCHEEKLLSKWRPPHGGSSIIVTSRRERWDLALGVTHLALDTFSMGESKSFLHQFQPDMTTAEATRIANLLGNLPLALHLAGSFLHCFQINVANYLVQLSEIDEPRFLDHPSLRGEGANYSPTANELHVARTFMVSFNHLLPDDPVDELATAIWARAAYFAPATPIPRALLLASLDEPKITQNQAETALDRLVAIGLIQRHLNDNLVLHQLLAKFAKSVVQNPLAQADVEDLIVTRAQQADMIRDPALIAPWQTHLRYLSNVAQPRQDRKSIRLIRALGSYLLVRGDYAEAKIKLDQALAISKQNLGPSHPETAATLNKLGTLHYWMGNLAESGPILEQALFLQVKILGESHPDVADTLNSLGLLSYERGDLTTAMTHLDRALSICQQTTPPDHPYTATCLNNLGMVHAGQGNLAEAKSYYERALAVREKILQPNHPLIANSLSNIGVILKWSGALAEARPYYEQALAICSLSLGDNHPYIAICLNNLGSLLSALDEFSQAKPLLEKALMIREKVLGLDHHLTAVSLNNLGRLLLKMKKTKQAHPYLEQALAIREKILGYKHPHTANSYQCLGQLYVETNNFAGAQVCFEKALEIHEMVYKADHPQTAASLHNLGCLYRQVDQLDKAQITLDRALTIRRNSLAPEHPEIGATLYELGLLYQSLNHFVEARRYLSEALLIFEQAQDDFHSQNIIQVLQKMEANA